MARKGAQRAIKPPSQSIGDRLFLIRLACGGGRPETVEQFVARVEGLTSVHYDPATISRLEAGKRKWTTKDVEVFAAVDPDQRGRSWLAWGVAAVQSLPDGTFEPV